MDISIEDNDSKGAFYLERDGRRLAEMTFSKAGQSRIIIDHTQVDDELRGQNVGKQLFLKAVAYARENKLVILPLCPFANALFKKFPEYQDVLDK